MMRESFSDTVKQAAHGNWPFTLQALGINAKYLDGKNHPCPACGGKDRFQFTLRGNGADYGRFACRGMDEQGGDGFALVRHVFGLSFPDAVKAVANVLGISADSIFNNNYMAIPYAVPATSQVVQMVDRTDKVQAVFDSCVAIRPDNQAGKYLLNRGLNWVCLPTGENSPLRNCTALDYWHVADNKPVMLGTFPALVAQITKADGSLAGMHRIYLSQDANKLVLHGRDGVLLPNKKLQAAHDGALAGAACRLYSIWADGRLALTEGIETALAVHRMTGLAVWACISTSGLKSFLVPDGVREIIIYADNDRPDHKGRNAGKEAAYILAARLVAEGYKVSVLLPPVAGTDWMDVMNDEINKEQA
ncbi:MULTISPECIES: toprim domain-containing protein [Deefgea]|uniref:DNA primase/helicase Gp4 N-terminal Bacteriophage T7-like domain-containing protein n=1 Tax=Deefgea chitinilytica TaxID=570276 RepID=A0ABS2CBL5_9NEIS|nr:MULTISPECIES: toprim domain-containing protein [Deefgea]MBM5571535.1 hypothetical protein [Deefgea chitinilytica]MBM9888768.1 toprim domain-containing protein [Deefgea sp. CFH1-16]